MQRNSLPPDYGTIPNDWPANCYAWVSRGPQAGTWRILPARVAAYRARFETPSLPTVAEQAAPASRPSSGGSLAFAAFLVALAVGPALAVALVVGLLTQSLTIATAAGVGAQVLTLAKLFSG